MLGRLMKEGVEGMKNVGIIENGLIHRLLMGEDVTDVIHAREMTVEREVIIVIAVRRGEGRDPHHHRHHLRRNKKRSIRSIIIIRGGIHHPLQTEVQA